METKHGYILGGQANIPRDSKNQWHGDKKAFLFVLSGMDVHSPSNIKLKNQDEQYAVCTISRSGPIFGASPDLTVNRSFLSIGTGVSYDRGPSVHLAKDANGEYKRLEIKEMEVFCVSRTLPPTTHLSGKRHQSHSQNL